MGACISAAHDTTGTLAAYAAAALRRKLPPPVVAKAKVHLLDTIAAMVSGTRLTAGRSALAYVTGQGGVREASIVGTTLRTSAVNAALVNGMFAHADETDDSHPASLTHPGCAVIPAALAMAERHERDGVALLRAIVLGYDICTRAVLALGYERMVAQARSTHAVGGLFGAAAAAGALAGITARAMRYLFTYAVQQASGTMCWFGDTGHIEKAFDFAGMPARNGVSAATMVASGMTAADDPFFGPKNFFDAFCPDADREAIARDLGTRFEILNTNIKRWSVGSPNQSVLDALELLIENEPFDVSQVERVEVELPAGSLPVVDNRNLPGVCAQYLIAVMLLDGTVSFAAAHDRKRMTNARVRSVWSKVRLIASSELQQARPARQAIVRLHLSGGRTLTQRTVAVRGTVENPMNQREIETKALDLMAPVLGTNRAKRAIEAVANIEGLYDVRRLRPLLASRAR
jgi:2-methylcitrate dehydratase PrpD